MTRESVIAHGVRREAIRKQFVRQRAGGWIDAGNIAEHMLSNAGMFPCLDTRVWCYLAPWYLQVQR